MSKKPVQKSVEVTEAELAAAQTEVQTRRYKGQGEVDHDLFKLAPADMKKNVSFTAVPRYEFFSHAHIFHTVDSFGTPQELSAPVGGHFHPMIVTHVKDGVPVIECGPASRHVLRRDPETGETQKVVEPIPFDRHTHEVHYLGSERIKIRQINAEFAKLEAAMKSRVPSLDGVRG